MVDESAAIADVAKDTALVDITQILLEIRNFGWELNINFCDDLGSFLKIFASSTLLSSEENCIFLEVTYRLQK